MNSGIPIYLISGFLEGGKTSFIKYTMEQDYFNDGEKTLLIVCEEGEEEYSPADLARLHTIMVTLENESDLTPEYLKDLRRKYRPERVIIEYNGMWRMGTLTEMKLPAGYELYQIVSVFDASTFQLYLNNMKAFIVDMVTTSELILFNRATPDMPLAMFKRSIRAVNRMGQVVFEDDKGDPVEFEEELPYDLSKPLVEIGDDDFGIWYVDALDNPERYDGKMFHCKGRVMKNMQFPKGTFLPARNAMTCCAADIAPVGFLTHYDQAASLKNRDWVTVTARLKWEYCPSYEDEGPVLYAISAQPAQPPKDDVVYFN